MLIITISLKLNAIFIWKIDTKLNFTSFFVVPLTTYILGANEPSHENFYSSVDTVPNLVYLGNKFNFIL